MCTRDWCVMAASSRVMNNGEGQAPESQKFFVILVASLWLTLDSEHVLQCELELSHVCARRTDLAEVRHRQVRTGISPVRVVR
jgi:hypothetical protein